jgi:hypothetical protein
MTTDITDKIIVCVDGADRFYDYDQFGLSFNSSESEILSAIRPAVQETFGVDLGSSGNAFYKTRKAVDSRNTYVIPNSTAGLT